MQATGLVILTFAAAALDGVLAGASLDQSIKQLPARRRMGAVAFSVYSRAADLGNGIIWYAALGISAALVTIAAAVVTSIAGSGEPLPIILAAVLSVLHSLVTTRAAPINFRQRAVPEDEAALTAIFNSFAHWQTLRVILQTLTFAAVLWAIFALR